jgi:hypothetical protein
MALQGFGVNTNSMKSLAMVRTWEVHRQKAVDPEASAMDKAAARREKT